MVVGSATKHAAWSEQSVYGTYEILPIVSMFDYGKRDDCRTTAKFDGRFVEVFGMEGDAVSVPADGSP